jgi:phospholipid/cholesterol/gamma-HCH transport system permease protein
LTDRTTRKAKSPTTKTRAHKSDRGSESVRKYDARSGTREPEDEKYIPGSQIAGRVVDAVRTLGEQTAFIGNSLGSTVDAVRRYPGEVLRLIAVFGMGTGALAVIGGTVVIVGFLTLTTGALIAVQGYNTLSNVGI